MAERNLRLKYIDLFCGIGSFHNSFQKLGFLCIMSCDIEESCRNTYKENYNQIPLGDIVQINPSECDDFDIVCAGFPCQSFSNIGKQLGFNDERGKMFHQIMRFVDAKNPKVVIMENVSALLTHDNGNTFKKMQTELYNRNYVVKHKILLCSKYGIPQNRKRLFIVAHQKEIDFEFPEEHKQNPTLSQYMDMNFKEKYCKTIRCGGRRSPFGDKHNWDGYIVNEQKYVLTVADCKKLQGFDSDFKLIGTETQQYKMLGNTIPTNLTYEIGKSILKAFQQNNHQIQISQINAQQ